LQDYASISLESRTGIGLLSLGASRAGLSVTQNCPVCFKVQRDEKVKFFWS